VRVLRELTARVSGPHLLAVSMFFGSFAWSFVFVSLPFHIQRVSPLDATSTLRWTGWIVGITSLVTVLTSPIWGRYAARGNPKACYVAVEALQGLGFFVMALARTLPELFLARLILGAMGAASTLGFIMVGRGAEGAEIRRRVAALQSSMTVGQVIGPLFGAIAAARLGIRGSFVLGGTILIGCAALVHWAVPRPPDARQAGAAARPVRPREVAVVTLIVLGGSIQVFYFTSILPHVLPGLGVEAERTLEVGGVLIFISGVAAALGALAVPRLGELFPERRLIGGLLVASSVSVAALAVVGSVWAYGGLRFLQVLSIAPVFPLIVSRVVQHAGGSAIGVINAARIGAGFIGPVAATSLLAWTSPAFVYCLLASIGLACVPLVRLRERGART
jgi:MFS transporter, DHA1 family, multidrug resistance protein